MLAFHSSQRLSGALAGLVVAALALAGCALEEDSTARPGSKDGNTVVKAGYLHTVAVDSHMWLGMEEGLFADHGLEIEPVKFDTGLELSTALRGGDVDVAIMGAVLSNFPAQGGSTVFLANDVEYDTAQLWAAPGSGINGVEDLAGKKVLTTEGTTAHVYLHTALKENGVDPSKVRIVNTDMPSAVSGFLSGAAPAVVLWVPFDKTVEEKMPDARLIDSAKNYYPEAAILGGWLASDDFYENHRDTLLQITGAWLEANDLLVNDTEASLETIHEAAYADDQSLADTKRNFTFEKVFTNEEWAEMYENGEVEQWIGQVESVFVEIGGLPKYVEPSEFFTAEVFLDAYDEWKGSN
jgi:NitT/TauT family transport system substrate-binding protein